MNRRDFVRSGTALLGPAFLGAVPLAAASASTSASASAAGAGAGAAENPPARRLKLGFLGVEYSHAAEKIRLAKQSADFELVGVWAETEALRETYSRQGVRVATAEEILAESEVVFVESAVRTHASLARRALEAGRHVHLEKPPALDLAEFDEVVRLAKAGGRRLQVGYMWRHNPGLRVAIEAARAGWLGDVFLVRATINNTLDAKRRPEWAEFPGGVLFELGSHLVDAIVRLLGRPDGVTSFLKTHGAANDALADNNVAVFEYPRATAVITSSTLQPNSGAHRAFEIYGTRGSAVLRPIEPPTLQLDLAAAVGPYRAGSQTVPLPEYRRYQAEFGELAESIRSGRPLSISPDEERVVQETLLRACRRP